MTSCLARARRRHVLREDQHDADQRDLAHALPTGDGQRRLRHGHGADNQVDQNREIERPPVQPAAAHDRKTHQPGDRSRGIGDVRGGDRGGLDDHVQEQETP